MKFILGFVTAAIIFSAAGYAQSLTIDTFVTNYLMALANGHDENREARIIQTDSEGRVICSPTGR